MTFSLAIREGVLVRSPLDGLLPSERPRQVNAKQPRRLTSEEVAGERAERGVTQRVEAEPLALVVVLDA